jgi:hypothetical protein
MESGTPPCRDSSWRAEGSTTADRRIYRSALLGVESKTNKINEKLVLLF